MRPIGNHAGGKNQNDKPASQEQSGGFAPGDLVAAVQDEPGQQRDGEHRDKDRVAEPAGVAVVLTITFNGWMSRSPFRRKSSGTCGWGFTPESGDYAFDELRFA